MTWLIVCLRLLPDCADRTIVNDEVGEDKHVFSLDVAEWILARTGD